MTFEGCCGGGFEWLRARERGAWRRSAVKAGACDVEGVGGRRRVVSYMCMSVCSGCVMFSRRGQAGVVACGEVWEADGEWMWSGESKGGVLAWLAGVGAVAAAAAAALVPCSHSLLLLPPRSLLLAEAGLDQASNLAHARMRRSEALQRLLCV